MNIASVQDSSVQLGNLQTQGISLTQKRKADPAKIDATAKEFEAQFIAQMIGTMFATVEEDEMLGGGSAESTFKSFLTDEYGKIIAKSGGVGVADQVKREMLRMQEKGGK